MEREQMRERSASEPDRTVDGRPRYEPPEILNISKSWGAGAQPGFPSGPKAPDRAPGQKEEID